MAFKMKGFNPGNGTGMSSAFNKASNDPPKRDRPIDKLLSGDFKGVRDDWKSFNEKNKENNANIIQATVPDIPIIGPGKIFKGIKNAKSIIQTGKNIISKGKKLFTKGKVKPTTPKPTTPKVRELGHYGEITSQKNIDDILNITKTRGRMYDDLYTKKPWEWSSKNFIKQPSVSGRQMVDLNVKGLPPQRFYRSTGGGGKLIDGKPSTGKWVPLEGYGHLKGGHNVKNWFVKGDGWDKGYGSKLFNDMDFYINKFAK